MSKLSSRILVISMKIANMSGTAHWWQYSNLWGFFIARPQSDVQLFTSPRTGQPIEENRSHDAFELMRILIDES